MRSILGALRREKPRQSASAVIGASASVPDFGFMSINNSLGASAAITELSSHLDSLLQDFDTDNDFGAQRRQVQRKLKKQAEKYTNCRLCGGDGIKPWNFDAATLRLVEIVVKCAVAVYDDNAVFSYDGFSFDVVCRTSASKVGVNKATSFTKVTPKQDMIDSSGSDFPALIISVRGSSSPIDWVVNANLHAREAADLFDSAAWLSDGESKQGFSVHSGFWNAASSLLPLVKQQIASASSSDSAVTHVIFTGHSAGGAVSSLLYLHMLGIASTSFPSTKLSLVTFGSPPVTNPSVMPLVIPHIEAQENPGMLLAIANEGDPVPRVDRDYVLSLLDLYRSIERLPPISNQPHEVSDEVGGQNTWPLPSRSLHTVGNIIVLRDMDPEGEETQIKAFQVSDRLFSKLLYCNVETHGKVVYEANIEALSGSQENT